MGTLVTEHTVQFGMFRRTGFQQFLDFPMTGATLLIGNLVSIGRRKGLMHLMTTDTVFKRLAFPMWFVTLRQAVGDETMFDMTKRTIDL